MRTTTRFALLLSASLFAAACDGGNAPSGGGGDPAAGGPSGLPPIPVDSPTVSVGGRVVDFTSGMALTGGVAVTTTGITPAPSVTVTGPGFVVEKVPANSVLFLLASSPPDYRSTYNPKVTVVSSDVTGVELRAFKESTLAQLATAFAVNPAAGTGVLVIRVVDDKGVPKAGVPAAALGVDGAKGPFFLDANRAAAPTATATTASGYALFFDVRAGQATVKSAAGQQITIDSGALPVAINVVTLADVVAKAPGTTTTVLKSIDFATQVYPIFDKRGCTRCHSGGGPGKDLGGLFLDGGINLAYREVVTEISPNTKTTRVNLKEPEKSLILTRPLYENPPDVHPTATFATTADPDYQLILTWIKEGAKQTP